MFAQSLKLGVAFASTERAGLFDESLELVGLHDGTWGFHIGGSSKVVVRSVVEFSIIREGGDFLSRSLQPGRKGSFGSSG